LAFGALVQVNANTAVTAAFAEPLRLAKNQLGLFLVSDGGVGADYVGYGLTVNSTTYNFGMVIPRTKRDAWGTAPGP
jgi:hypothetical protein